MGDIDRVQRTAPAIQPDVRAHKIGHVDQRDGRRQHHHERPGLEDQVELTLVEELEPPPEPPRLADEGGLDLAV